MNKNVKTCFEVVWYVIAFLLIQLVVQLPMPEHRAAVPLIVSAARCSGMGIV